MDNDLFSPTRNSDSDFTGGFSLSYNGRAENSVHKRFDSVLAVFDNLTLNVERKNTSPYKGLEIGLYGFTPMDIEDEGVLPEDRPYASLLYVSSNRSYTSTGEHTWSSSLTLGVLGLGLFGSAQNSIHSLVGSDEAKGWHNQVSDGGELTFRYQLAYMDHWNQPKATEKANFKTTYFASVGYLTELGISLSSTSSITSSFGSRFNPELISYGEKVSDVALAYEGEKKHSFWGGVSIKARLYNAFLQGQFKSSVHTLNKNQLETFIAEAWVGYTLRMNQDYKLSYVLRGQTSEVKTNEGKRKLIWGALVFSRHY